MMYIIPIYIINSVNLIHFFCSVAEIQIPACKGVSFTSGSIEHEVSCGACKLLGIVFAVVDTPCQIIKNRHWFKCGVLKIFKGEIVV